MMKITVISMGKLKEKYFVAAADEYLKRLQRYCDLKLIELNPQNLPENPSEREIEAALKKEAEQIKKNILPDCFKISLCVEGKHFSSEEFAELLGEKANSGKPICFIIGSSYGLFNEIKEISDLCLSVSKMTFPHKLFRIMLLEQIYRAFKINGGGTYHK